MSALGRGILALAFAAGTMTGAPLAAQDKPPATVQLSLEQMRHAAELNLRNGETGRALVFANALLERDAQDTTALLIRAHALRVLRDYTGAQGAARTAWRVAKTDNHKYTAAMLMAQAMSADQKRTRAQFWLRRAAQVAPTQGHAVRAAQDFRYVQQRNPWQTNLSFTLAPNSNINNGSARETSALLYRLLNPLDIDGFGEVTLGAESRALSGIETGFDVSSRYRFAQTERIAHDLRFGLSYRTYRLSGTSRDALAEENANRVARGEVSQTVTGRDFAYGTVQLGYGYKQLRHDKRGEFSFSADIGQSFYGGARYNSFARASLGQSYHTSAVTKLTFGATADLRRAQRGIDQDTLYLNAGMSRKLGNGDGLYLGVALSGARSEAERAEYQEIAVRSGYVLGREVMGTALQFGLSTSFRSYDVSPHDPDGRDEFKISAEATATFRQIDYYGFNPTVSLTASTTNSNIGLYDVNRLGLSIGIASAF